ncbi:hypothetical protein EN816_00595 [Mesorhizobium sp. M8A.F.Ca.ET.173.01.1.1]|nr:hypothetical protein EN816_00595 [Mesorhizobium sp. M8A.F.Ca.ET.173.01.1.1]
MSERIATLHSVERTSPKGEGQTFIGTCRLCGKTGLTFANMGEECENQRGLTESQSLLEALDPEPHP